VEPMHVDQREDRGWTVVRVRGVVDVAAAPRLREVLQAAQFSGSVRVVVDLTEVELLDSFGLGVLVGARKRAVSHDGELAVVVTNPRLQHVFELTGLAATLQVVPSLDEVLDA
jgi:anti-sigma B factor antagonist